MVYVRYRTEGQPAPMHYRESSNRCEVALSQP